MVAIIIIIIIIVMEYIVVSNACQNVRAKKKEMAKIFKKEAAKWILMSYINI